MSSRRLARVNDDRQIALARQLDLRAEDVLLHVARREVVVIVEADLADRARPDARRAASSTASTRLGRHRPANSPAWCGWMPAANRTAGQASRDQLAAPDFLGVAGRQDAQRAAMTPAARARGRRRASRSPANSSPARWQWRESISRHRDSRARAASPDRSRRASACRRRGSRRAPCRSTRCPSAWRASG